MLEYLKSDLYRYEGKTSLKSFIKYYRKNAGLELWDFEEHDDIHDHVHGDE